MAKASSVSEVEVSPSMVTALKVSTTPSRNSACSTGAAIGASVKTKASIVAMSGAIMPAPLAKPLMVTSAPAMRARRGGELRERVGGHDRARRFAIGSGAARRRASSMTPSKACAGSGSPITPVEARNTSVGLAAGRGGGELAR